MTLESALTTYGYFALVIGTFLEGETILIAAGFLAHRGYLELPWVIVSAFLGTLAGDQLYFLLGRIKGMDFIESRPRWKANSTRVISLLQNHQLSVFIGFRFLYGIRTITPFIIGASGMSPPRFLTWNSISAATWAVAFGTLGYLFGQAVEVMLEKAKQYEIWVVALVFLFGAATWITHLFKK
jgi:membrane protein DedA with SNARE-associated domain